MSLAASIGCATIGAAAGAVLPRVAYRLTVPFGTPSRSGCVHCGEPFPPGRAAWVRPGAPCRCPGRARPSTVSAVLASALAAGVIGWSGLPLLAAAAVLGVLLALIDLRCLRLPDPLVAALGVAVVLPLTVLAVTAGEPGRIGRALLAAGGCFAAYLLAALLPGGGVGFGDVKLSAVLGFLLGWIGWSAVLTGLIVPQLINGPIALFLLLTGRARRGTALPFGPALLAGAVIAVAVASPG
jgi:leader peptidase (prepilin peptidase)/N-methyltransferase